MQITVERRIHAPVEDVWRAFNAPEEIVQWDGSPAWQTVWAQNELRAGGWLRLRMAGRQGGPGFDFAARYTRVEPHRLIEWQDEEGRRVRVEFLPWEGGVTLRQTFEAEAPERADAERADWQAVLDRFARHVMARHPG